MSGFDFKLSGVGSSFMSVSTGRTPLKEISSNLKGGPIRVINHSSSSSSTTLSTSFAEKASEKTLASFLESDIGSSWNDTSTDELLQAKIDHLERERLELSLQIHSRDEKERARKLKMEQLESKMKLLETAKSEAVAQVEVLRKEKEAIEKRLQESSQATTQQKAPSVSASSQSIANSIHSMVESATPDYLSGTEATQGLWSKMTAASRELRRLEEESKELKREKEEQSSAHLIALEEVSKLKAVIEKGKATLLALRGQVEEARGKQQQLEDINTQLNSILNEASVKESQLLATIDSQKIVADDSEDRIRILELDLAESRNLVARLEQSNLERDQQQLAQFDGDMSMSDESLKELVDGNNPRVLSLIEELRQRLYESEQKRRKLNNALQDLRGNIRVLVRCRPFLRADGENRESSIVCNRDGTSISFAKCDGKVFAFDSVFNADTTQENVYSSISELVQSAIDGYRVCVFSYGQTGSGKTWTMSGDKSGSQRGIIPRSVEQVIHQAITMRDQGWDTTVTASVVELYNEELRDLLSPRTASSSSRNNDDDKEKLKISNLQGRVTVSGLTQVDIDCSTTSGGLNQLDQLLETAKRARVTISTGMNEQSSRSHMLFMLEITCRHTDGTTVTRGGLRLVDLAGSERLDRTGTANDAARLKETVNINKSLSCLADVFMALSNKQQHIPYRNSKLTMLLQDCMSGDGKALMIVNVSPTQASAQETLCSLRFAAQVSTSPRLHFPCTLLDMIL